MLELLIALSYHSGMNIFGENQKVKIKSRTQMAVIGIVMLLTGGLLFTIGLPLSFFVIGIPFVIFGVLIMLLGGIVILTSPFYKVK